MRDIDIYSLCELTCCLSSAGHVASIPDGRSGSVQASPHRRSVSRLLQGGASTDHIADAVAGGAAPQGAGVLSKRASLHDEGGSRNRTPDESDQRGARSFRMILARSEVFLAGTRGDRWNERLAGGRPSSPRSRGIGLAVRPTWRHGVKVVRAARTFCFHTDTRLRSPANVTDRAGGRRPARSGAPSEFRRVVTAPDVPARPAGAHTLNTSPQAGRPLT